MLAKCMMLMTAGCLANMIAFPAGDRMPPMGVAYTVVMTTLYGGAFATAGTEDNSKSELWWK